MSTETLELGEAGPGMDAIREPTAGAAEYVTVLSAQDPLTTLILPATGDPSPETNILRTADVIAEPAGIVDRLKRSRMRRVG